MAIDMRASKDAPDNTFDLTSAGSRPVKRSFTIAGHRTSISLEASFWSALKALAAEERIPVAQLISRIDGQRGDGGLSSAVRVWILDRYRNRSESGRQSG